MSCREHYQWNMDIWGVDGVEAEAELLAAIVTSFRDMGITAADVGIKVSSLFWLNVIISLKLFLTGQQQKDFDWIDGILWYFCCAAKEIACLKRSL